MAKRTRRTVSVPSVDHAGDAAMAFANIQHTMMHTVDRPYMVDHVAPVATDDVDDFNVDLFLSCDTADYPTGDDGRSVTYVPVNDPMPEFTREIGPVARGGHVRKSVSYDGFIKFDCIVCGRRSHRRPNLAYRITCMPCIRAAGRIDD